MLVLDGGYGEGGGQILRSALSLSIITGQAFRLEKYTRAPVQDRDYGTSI